MRHPDQAISLHRPFQNNAAFHVLLSRDTPRSIDAATRRNGVGAKAEAVVAAAARIIIIKRAKAIVVVVVSFAFFVRRRRLLYRKKAKSGGCDCAKGGSDSLLPCEWERSLVPL